MRRYLSSGPSESLYPVSRALALSCGTVLPFIHQLLSSQMNPILAATGTKDYETGCQAVSSRAGSLVHSMLRYPAETNLGFPGFGPLNLGLSSWGDISPASHENWHLRRATCTRMRETGISEYPRCHPLSLYAGVAEC